MKPQDGKIQYKNWIYWLITDVGHGKCFVESVPGMNYLRVQSIRQWAKTSFLMCSIFVCSSCLAVNCWETLLNFGSFFLFLFPFCFYLFMLNFLLLTVKNKLKVILLFCRYVFEFWATRPVLIHWKHSWKTKQRTKHL